MTPEIASLLYDHGPTLGFVVAALIWIARRLNQHEELCHRRELYTRETLAMMKTEQKNIKEDVEELKEHSRSKT